VSLCGIPSSPFNTGSQIKSFAFSRGTHRTLPSAKP